MRTGRGAVLGTLGSRVAELDREDIRCAIKHVFRVLRPERPFTAMQYREINRHSARLARRHFPYRTAARMLLRPLQLTPICNRRRHR